jgi:RimJ/RimL family protein N-acetyltransferase
MLVMLPRQTGSITLRQLAAADLRAFQAYRHDAELGRYQGWSATDDEAAATFISQMSSAPLLQPDLWSQIGIADTATNELIGDIGLLLSCSEEHAEIGFTLRRESHGRGFALAAVREAIRLVLDVTRAQRVLAITDARNAPSIRLLERIGMTRVSSETTVFRDEPCVEHTYAIAR